MTDWLRKGFAIARVRSIRQDRKIRAQPLLLAFQVFPIVVGTFAIVGRVPIGGNIWAAPGAFVFGRRLATGQDLASVLQGAKGLAGLLFVLFVYGTILRVGTESTLERDAEHLLTAVSPRALSLGAILENVVFTARLAGIVVVAGVVAFAVGAGSAVAVVPLLLGATTLAVTAVALGFVVALAVRLSFRRWRILRHHRVLVGAPLVASYFGIFVQFRRSMELLAALPVGWYGDLALVFHPGLGSGFRAVSVLVGSVLTVGLAIELGTRLGTRLWLGDPPEQASETTSGSRWPWLERFLSRPTGAVVRATWQRVTRKPQALLFVVLPIVLVASGGVELVRRQPTTLPVVVGFYGTLAIGMGVTLNPLGNEGPMLPAILTSPSGATALVRGYLFSTALPGVGLIVVSAVVAGLLVRTPVLGLVALSVFFVVFATSAATVSIAVGVALPQFEGLRPTASSGIQAPRLEAVTAYMVLLFVLVMPAMASGVWAWQTPTGLTGPHLDVIAAGFAVTALLTMTAGLVSYRYASTRIARYDRSA